MDEVILEYQALQLRMLSDPPAGEISCHQVGVDGFVGETKGLFLCENRTPRGNRSSGERLSASASREGAGPARR